MHSRIVLLSALIALAGCSGDSPTYTPMGGNACIPTATQVCMMGNNFSPANLTIGHGTTVTWKNGDPRNHTVGNATGSADTYTSGFIASGGTFSHTFANPGTYAYYCGIHGADGNPPTGMHGTITVN
ncbi:MAG TPA: plastocyanin/azurin family copper-binding protein [Gemmatimonadales bacterium]|nr:plastocyanin/azurin family copper-binding protein [Gemmatimonadales bacterium]